MKKKQYISLKQLAKEIHLDPSNARKYIIAQGFNFLKKRTMDSKNQLANVLTKEDAETIKMLREEQGFYPKRKVIAVEKGYFYAVQLEPKLDPHRIKLGWTNDTKRRLQTFHSSSPYAKLIKSWPCMRIWEQTAIDSITRNNYRKISFEIFHCADIKDLIKRGNDFFKLMPTISNKFS